MTGFVDRYAPLFVKILNLGRGRVIGSLILLICVFLHATNLETGPIPGLRLALFDSYQQIQPRIRASAPVTIVAIDEKALDHYGQWPWPRDLMAKLLENLNTHRPIAMGLDIIMAEPDRLSPEKMPWKDQAPAFVKDWLKSIQGNDAALANTLSRSRVAMGIAGLEDGKIDPKAPLAASQVGDASLVSRLRAYPAELRSLPQLDRAAPGHGLLTVDIDADGIVRRFPLAAQLGDRIAPSLDLEVLRLAVGANWFTLNGSSEGIQSVSVGQLEIPTQRNGGIWIHYSMPDPTRFVSAADILDKTADPQMLTDKLVLIGVTGLGLVDYPATPVAARMSGVEVRAQVIENIFDQSILERPDWAGPTEIGLLIALGLLAIWIVPNIQPKFSPLLWMGATGISLAFGFAGYSFSLVLIDTVTPGLGGALVFVTMLTMVLIETDQQKKRYQLDLAVQREKEAKMAGELDAAKRIQMGILPDARLINDPRVDISAFLEPARDIGGDLYDLFKVDEDHLFFMVGDVAGKGIPASLFMALGKSLYKSAVLRRQTDIAAIMSDANAEISRDNPEMMFITAFAGLLNLKTGELQYCNAGHDTPHLFTRGGEIGQLDSIGGPPLCVLEDMQYPGETRQLEPGQSILLITDGVTEAMNQQGDFYTADRLGKAVKKIPANHTAEEIIHRLYADVKVHAAGAEPSDDITILALTWQGPDATN